MKIKTISQFEEQSGEYKNLSLKLQKEDSQIEKKIAQLKKEHNEKTKADRKTVNTLESELMDYAEENKKELFKDGKTYETPFVKVKLRSSTRIVFDLDDEDIIKKIKQYYKDWKNRFIKREEKLDKNVMKSAIKSKELTPDKMKKLGIKEEENESLSISIK